MKIIGGKLKGRNFFMPKDIRPTQNIVREAIFDIIGQDLTGLAFLELFAGSGAVSFEAVSRNAREVVMVERDSRCLSVLENNLRVLGLKSYPGQSEGIQVVATDVFATIKRFTQQGKKFDIVFLDPPFGEKPSGLAPLASGLAKKTLKHLTSYDIVHANAFVIIQHDKHEILPDAEGRFLLIRQKKYGTSLLTIYQAK